MRLFAVGLATLLPLTPAIAAAPTEADPPWTLAISGGATAFDDDAARPFGSVSIARDIDALTLGIAASVVDSGQRGVRASLPSTTYQLTVSADYALGSLTVNGHGAIGRRTFATRRLAGGRASLDFDGTTLGAGATLAYDQAIGARTLFSPFASVDYSQVDTALLASTATGSVVREQRESGVTGGIGATLAHGVGAGARHLLGLYVAGFTTSNDAASGPGGGATAGTRRFTDGDGRSDQWLEAGPTVSVALGRAARLDIAAVRTFGLTAGNVTTASLTLRHRF